MSQPLTFGGGFPAADFGQKVDLGACSPGSPHRAAAPPPAPGAGASPGNDSNQRSGHRSSSPGRGCFRIDLGCGGTLGLVKPAVPQKRHLDSTRRFVGFVRTPQGKPGPVVLDSPEARRAFGAETAVSLEELGSAKEGDEVMFRVRLDEGGKPQAYGLKRLTAVDPARPPAP